jgi:hypothetical protein
MFKQVEITPAIRSKLAKSYGDADLRTDDLAVFESVAGNTKPLRRRSGLFAGARISPSTFEAMFAHTENGNSVPLAVMHRNGIPVGRVFASSLHPSSDGHTRMNTLFYLPKRESDLVHKVNTGVLSDVSLGFDPKALRCSTCGWDYKGEDAAFSNLLNCSCPEGHEIGKNGVHAKVEGLSDWREMSLVDRGAVVGSHILPRPQHTREPNPLLLAARGFDPELLTCFCSVSETEDLIIIPEKSKMTEEQVLQLKLDHALAARDVATLTASVEAVKTTTAAEVTTLKAKVTELEASLASATAGDVATLRAENEVLKADKLALVGLVDKRITAAFAVTGRTGAAAVVPEKVADKIIMHDELQAALGAAIPIGGRGVPSVGSGGGSEATGANFSAFKSK